MGELRSAVRERVFRLPIRSVAESLNLAEPTVRALIATGELKGGVDAEGAYVMSNDLIAYVEEQKALSYEDRSRTGKRLVIL